MSKVLDGIEAAEFDQLIEQFIEREDPNAMSVEALDEAVRQQFEKVAMIREIQLSELIARTTGSESTDSLPHP
jgi:hypothetical protein